MDLLKHLGHKLEDKFERVFEGDKQEEQGEQHQQSQEQHDASASYEARPDESTVNRFESFAPQSSGQAKWSLSMSPYFSHLRSLTRSQVC